MSTQQILQAQKREVWFTKVAEFLSVRTLLSQFWNDVNDRKLENTKYVICNLQDETLTRIQNNDFYDNSHIESEIALRASELLQLASPIKILFGVVLDRLMIDLNATATTLEDEATVTIIEIKSRRSLLVKLREKQNALLQKNYRDDDITAVNDGDVSPSNMTTQINDTLRSSIICTSTAQIISLLDSLKDSESKGLFTVVRVKNR
jgi:hypothetical protein